MTLPSGVWPAALLLGLAVVTVAPGCGRAGSAIGGGASTGDSSGVADRPSEVLATVGGEAITLADLRARAGDDLDGLEIRYRLARNKVIETALDSIVRERLLASEARKRGVSVDSLVILEAGGDLDPGEAEIAGWYEQNRGRLQGLTLAQLRPQIAEYLRAQRREVAVRGLEQRLASEHDVSILFEPYRVSFDDDGAPALGPADAPVTLVIFSDFQCPFCGQFYPTLKRLEQDFGRRLRVVFRQYPIANLHPFAQKAAEASLCAQEQDRFWEMHDLLFQEQDRLGIEDLKEKAGRLGLDSSRFDPCLDSGRYVERIRNDQQLAGRIGVTGTPSIFINGIAMDAGALPRDVVAGAIRKEIDRAGR